MKGREPVHFALSDVTLSLSGLVLIGCAVGVCGSFWGVGGGWIMTPALFLLGLPYHFAVGSSLAYTFGMVLLSTIRHAGIGNTDCRMGIWLMVGITPGVEIGSRMVTFLEARRLADDVIQWCYLVLLAGLAGFVLWESLRATGRRREADGDVVHLRAPSHRWVLPPMLTFPASGIDRLSLWLILGVGLFAGVLIGLLGIGGGVFLLPLMIYLFGMPTRMAVGTSLFSILFTSIYATFTHALQGNVDPLVVLFPLLGAAIGTQIGAAATGLVHGTRLRLYFGLAVAGAFVALALRQLGCSAAARISMLGLAAVMSLGIALFLIVGRWRQRQAALPDDAA
jgi:uncharacterized membrane protein YfcA